MWAVTGHPGAAVCPVCGTRAGRVHEHVLARPRDQRRGLDEVSLCWLKRIAKLEARQAYSFRNPANQRRRVHTACTRGNRRAQDATLRRSRLVTGRKHDPGY